MPDPFLDYLREGELGRGTIAGTTLPEMKPPSVAFAKPLMRPVAPAPVEEDPFLSHLRGMETTAPPPPPPSRGVLGDIASSVARGVTVGIPQFAGQAITGLGALTGIEPMKETGRAITGFAEELPEKFPSLAPSQEAMEGGVRGFLTGMGESLPVILGAAKGGAAIGALTAPVTGFLGPTVGAILGGMLGVFGTFGMAGKGRAYEEALAEGMPEDQAQSYSNKIGAIEGGVWSLLAPVEAATGGIAGKFIKKPAIDTIRKLLTPTLTKSLTGMAISVPAVTAAGMTSSALQARAAEEAGIPTPTPEEAAYHSIAPSIGISILFGLGTRGMRWKDRQAVFTSLKNPTVDPAFRNRAANTVFGNLRKIDPEVAQMWRREADLRIQGKREIPIDEDYMAWTTRSQRERVPATWGTPGGGVPAVIGPLEPQFIPREGKPKQLTTRVPEGVQFGEGFVMAEPGIFRRGEETYRLSGPEPMGLLGGPEKAIPQLPFRPEPWPTLAPDVGFLRISKNSFREILNPRDVVKKNAKPILGEKTLSLKEAVAKGLVLPKEEKIAPVAGVSSAGVLPTDRPSTLAPGAFFHGTSDVNATKIIAGEPIEARYASHKDYPGFYLTGSRPLAETYGKQVADRGGKPTVMEIGIKDGAKVILEKNLIKQSGLAGKVSEMAGARARWAADNGYDIISRANGEFIVLNQAVMEVRGAPTEIPRKALGTPRAIGKVAPPAPTPILPEKPPLAAQMPLPQAQMDAIRAQGREMGGLGIATVQRIVTNLGEKIDVKKGKEVIDYLHANGEIEPQVGGGVAIHSYTFTGKVPEKVPIPLPKGVTPYKKGYGYTKTDAGWEIHGPEGKIETVKSRDQARAFIDRIKEGGEKPPAAPPLAPVPAPAPAPAPGEPTLPVATRGRPEEVVTPKGIKAQTQFKVVESNDLVTSIDINFRDNPAYNQELQPRDRDKVASMNQIMRIYNKLDPEQLAESRGADTGAPIVGPDNMVESGNGRAVAIQKLYHDTHANAEKYKTWLSENAERFGLTKEDVSKMKNPILVRENTTTMTPEERIAFSIDANTPTTLVMSAGEKARIDMDRLTPDVLSLFAPDESGNLMSASNRDFIRGFLAKIPANEMGEFITEKVAGGREANLSAQGLIRIKNAIVAKAYGKENADLITMMMESTENNIKNITNALLTASPKQAMLMDAIRRGDRHDLSISKEISDAARTISDLRNAGTRIDEYLLQGNLFGKNPIETELVKLFDDFKQTPRRIVDILDAYAKMVDIVGNPKQKALFGAEKPPERLSVLTAARGLVEEKYVTPEQKGLFPAEGELERGKPVEKVIPPEIPRGVPERPEIPAERIPAEPAPKPATELKVAAEPIPLTLNELFKSGRKEITEVELQALPDVQKGIKTSEEMKEYLAEKGIGITEPRTMVKEPKPAPSEKELPTEMDTFGVFMNPSPDQIQRFIKDAPQKSEAIPAIKVDDMIVVGSKTTHGALLTPEEIQAFIRQGKKIELGFIDKKTGDYYTKQEPKEMLVEKGFTGTMTSEDVGFAVNEFRMKFKDFPGVEIAPDFGDLPPNIRRYGKSDAAGVFDGKIYLVANKIKDAAHAREVIFHEAMGHWGLPKMMGKDYVSLLDKVIRDHGKDLGRIGEKYGLDLNKPKDLWRAAEERISEVAQKGDNPGLLRTIIASIKEWVSKTFGVDFKLSENDIRNLIRKTSESMRRGEISRASDSINFKTEILRRQAGHQLGADPKLKAGEMGRHWQNEPYFMSGDNVMSDGSWWKSLKDFRNKYTLGIKGEDLKFSERLYMLPWHIGQKFPNFRKLIDVQLNRDESREQMNHEMVQKAFAESKSETHEFLALPKDQAKDLFKVQTFSDDANVFFGTIGAKGGVSRDVPALQAKAKELLGKELNPEQVTAYYAWKKTMDNAWAKVRKQHEIMTFAPFEDKPWYVDLKKGFDEFSKTKQRGLTFKDFILQQMEPNLFKTGGKYSEAELKELGMAAERLEKPISKLKTLRDDMGRWKYYVPRFREKGDYVIRGYGKDDKIEVSVRAMDQITGARARDRFMKEYPGLRWEAKFEPQPIEEMYQKVSDIHLEQFIKKGIERAKRKEKITEEEAGHITDALFEAVADDLKARGFASHFIMREMGAAIKGYEAEKGQKVFYDYMTGLSGFLTKQRAAFDFFKSLEGIDPSKQPELFKEASSYVTDMLRNTDKYDKISGKVRAAAFTWYLSGSVKAAMVQFTQNFVTGVPHLGRVTKNPLKKYTQSMKDIAVWKARPDHLTKEEQGFLHEMHEKGIDTAQYLREIRGQMKSQTGGVLDQIGQVLATPFSGMEVFNRESASLAMFRVMRYEKGKSYQEAFDAARDYVYNTHYLYGKSNLPAWARAGTPGSRLARTAYTFRSFNHNFLLSLVQSLKGPEGKIKLDVMGRTLAYLVAFGGAGAIPFLDDLMEQMEKMTGTPYRSDMRKVLHGIGGEYLARFGMEGLPAILGADLTGSLKIGIPNVSFSDVYGVYGGMWDKGKKAMDSFQRADIYRGIESLAPVFIESPMKAYRMAMEGATTPTGKTMFDEEGKPVTLTAGETARQALAIRPERIAVIGKEKRSLQNVETHYSETRDDLYSKLRLAKPTDRADVFKQIRSYNLEVQKYKGIVPSITQEMIRNALRKKPDKKFMRFENR